MLDEKEKRSGNSDGPASTHVVFVHVTCAECRPFPIKVQHIPFEGRVTSPLCRSDEYSWGLASGVGHT